MLVCLRVLFCSIVLALGAVSALGTTLKGVEQEDLRLIQASFEQRSRECLSAPLAGESQDDRIRARRACEYKLRRKISEQVLAEKWEKLAGQVCAKVKKSTKSCAVTDPLLEVAEEQLVSTCEATCRSTVAPALINRIDCSMESICHRQGHETSASSDWNIASSCDVGAGQRARQEETSPVGVVSGVARAFNSLPTSLADYLSEVAVQSFKSNRKFLSDIYDHGYHDALMKEISRRAEVEKRFFEVERDRIKRMSQTMRASWRCLPPKEKVELACFAVVATASVLAREAGENRLMRVVGKGADALDIEAHAAKIIEDFADAKKGRGASDIKRGVAAEVTEMAPISKTVKVENCWTPPCSLAVTASRDTFEHVKSHMGWSREQEEYFENVLKHHREGKIRNEQEVDWWLNSPGPKEIASGKVNPDPSARPFRKGKPTSIFPEGVTPAEVIEALPRSAVKRIVREDDQAAFYHANYKGNQYQIVVCKLASCSSPSGKMVPEGEITTIFPICGPDVQRLVSLKQAKELLLRRQEISRQEFYETMPCAP